VPLRVGRLRGKVGGDALSTRSAGGGGDALAPSSDSGGASLQVVVEPLLSPASLQEQDVLARQMQLEDAYESAPSPALPRGSGTGDGPHVQRWTRWRPRTRR